ncbi:hypothetical protein WICMUC_002043 [Wickerhamomyces mucosus]|uniref:1,3-beta-glucan synthase n=1 Tax=Wickerhamomyces mucosus TaxID=1378264 RepID=A0A9P8PQH9_9ASCO|nr:hypothetical protein WICMUC_002043 [Wickerhamomyces mucosus]
MYSQSDQGAGNQSRNSLFADLGDGQMYDDTAQYNQRNQQPGNEVQDEDYNMDTENENGSSKYSDSPEFQLERQASTRDSFNFNSALTGRSAVAFSGFKTPRITSARWNERIKTSSDAKKLVSKDIDTSKRQSHIDLASEFFAAERGVFDALDNYHDPFPNWSDPEKIPITRKEIESIILDLMNVFGYQEDNAKNIFDYLLRLLDSRASRMSPHQALKSLHSDYIGGDNSNFKKWYFSVQLDIDDTLGFQNTKSNGQLKSSYINKKKKEGVDVREHDISFSYDESQKRWSENMTSLSVHDSITQLSIYLLCWGEANNIRFMPECLCFIFKCCNDYYYGLNVIKMKEKGNVKAKPFLEHVINPLYEYYRDECYELVDDCYIQRDRDHSSTIGYDDINQFFWYRKGLEKIRIKIGSESYSLVEYPPHERYLYLNSIQWDKCFHKTYREKRTWAHAFLNFNRIWIIHISFFWIFTMINSSVLYTPNYQQKLDNKPPLAITLSVIALNGPISVSINIIATILEFTFVPRSWPGARPLTMRLVILVTFFIVLIAPSGILFGWFQPLFGYRVSAKGALVLAIIQFGLSLVTTVSFAITPLSSLFASWGRLGKKDLREFLSNENFTNSVHKLKGNAALSSYGLWIAVLTLKFVESYFFFALSLEVPIRELSIINIKRCASEIIIGESFCRLQPKILLCLMCLTDLVLFFLDTYLWYIICNTFHSFCRSLYIGVSIWTPWRNIFSRLPKRIFSKIISSTPENSLKPKILVSQVWNAIIISMYREHLISLEHVQRLIYQQIIQTSSEGVETAILQEPNFFISHEDQIIESPLFESHAEAQRRIKFFAQSLSTPMPDPCSVAEMPTFTVLIPHYSEKITLTLREIIKEEEGYSNVTLLEYLKHLHPVEWNCFVEDTKMLAEENETESSTVDDSVEEANLENKNVTYPITKIDSLPFYSVGFKTATPEYILRTRIWASLHSQTLFRTISGFMNYSRAIKLMYDVENSFVAEASYFEGSEKDDDFTDTANPELNAQVRLEHAAVMALRKFRIVVSMQRMNEFSPDELANRDFILRAYPELQICYLEEEKSAENGEKCYYSSLIDGSCEVLENGQRKPKYRIKLSGNPILGDGKSDNQNHALIFSRGEYIQLIDANQDNYLEECLKIRSVLAEFEESAADKARLLYNHHDIDKQYEERFNILNPVAIIGTREYIFSENIGILGDVAAGKEQTFGTLFARTLARIGGKLHYGHPDFLNTIFMTTRGGVSKAQKGLHLNEDIYAGMNAVLRGGRIKHSEYIQCGKGRDLGFGSILNFNTKIGAGMGEQMLSREYYYLGTQLPLDRFLSFYYAHPGFHLNNIFIILSIQLFLMVTINLASLVNESVICEYNPNSPITDPRKPTGCSNLIPLIKWLERSILSIFVVFSISFVPLAVQELIERGVWRAFTRLGKHFLSFSPLFEVFVCKIYAQSLASDLSVGGARYIATGRGFATVRVPFHLLYSRFSGESFYFAISAMAMLFYCSLAMWNFALTYFWVTISALLISPFLYNPNQFSWNLFFMDYRKYLGWLWSGNSRGSEDSWIYYVRALRIQVTGSKRKKILGKTGDKLASDFKKPSFFNLLFSGIIPHILLISVVMYAFVFANSQNDIRNVTEGNSVVRILVFSFFPIIINLTILLIFFCISGAIGPFLTFFLPRFPSFVSTIVHSLVVINYVVSFELFWLTQNWDLKVSILGFYLCILIQGLVFQIITIIFLSREFKHDRSNKAWWSGKWASAGLGWGILTQPGRELLCKIIEVSIFTLDYILGHFILFAQIPILFIPYIDVWHTSLLFWLKPESHFRPQLLSKKKRRKRRLIVQFFSILFFFQFLVLIFLFLLPYIINDIMGVDIEDYLPEFISYIIQPEDGANHRKGLLAYRQMKQRKARL